MKKSLLILGKGDTNYADRNARRLAMYAKTAGIDVHRAIYSSIESLTNFKNQHINVMFFFPFAFWNEHCEVPEDTGLYGTSKQSYDMFRNFFLDVRQRLEDRLHQYKLNFIILPETAALDRDKIATLDLLKANGVPVSESIEYKTLQDIFEHVTPERGVFIKCRYGAEGKGITKLRHGQWKTNYRVEGGKLGNHDLYDRWEFTDITGRIELLEHLLEHDVIVEEEIISPTLFKGKKFDARAYVVDGEVPYFFLRINNIEHVITNFSQGAGVLHNPHKVIPADYTDVIRQTAADAAMALKSRFIGIDMMFDLCPENIRVVEAQTFTDFPDIRYLNLARHIVYDCELFK